MTVNIEQVDDTSTNDGDIIYKVSLYVGVRDLAGNPIDPVHLVQVTKENLLKELNSGLTILGSKIPWGALETDTHPPIITEISPKPSSTVPIESNVFLRLKDPFPASFIDKSSLKLTVNGIEVTEEIRIIEKNNEVIVEWIPKRIY